MDSRERSSRLCRIEASRPGSVKGWIVNISDFIGRQSQLLQVHDSAVLESKQP